MWFTEILISLSIVHGASAESLPALQCLRDFTQRYAQGPSYFTKLKKTEFDFSPSPMVENLEITERAKTEIDLKFVDKGKSGIRNNGMTVHYKSGDEVEIELGKSRGFGFLLNGLAETFAKKKMKLYSADVIERQIFTVNRAGFGYLARLIQMRLPEFEKGALGQLSNEGAGCHVQFKHDPKLDETIELDPQRAIPEIEQKYGTLAYLIYKMNRDLFPKFESLFERKKPMTIQISPAFADFNLDLDAAHLPTKFELFFGGQILGRYEFSETKMPQ